METSEMATAVQFGNTLASLRDIPQDIMEAFAKMAGDTFSGMTASSMRFIRMNGSQFNLCEGKEITTVDRLICVLLGAASCNHAVWYRKSYSQTTASEPDLVWERPTDDTFPDAFPVELRQKIDVQGQKRWAFQIKRRTVWAIVQPGTDGGMYIDFDHPYILDIPSMSLYGSSRTDANEYKWNSLGVLCSRSSTQGIVVYPSMFPIQIAADPTVRGNSGVMVFKPMRNPADNSLSFLDQGTIVKIFELSQSKEIRDLCKVREKLTLDENPAPVPGAATPVTPHPVAGPASAPTSETPQSAQVQPQQQAPVTSTPSAAAGSDTASLLSQAQSFLAGAGQAPQPVTTPTDNVEAMLAALTNTH